MNKFVNLHAHSSDGSLLDGASPISKIVERTVKLGYTACSITEHGSLYSCVKLEKECKGAGIKPIQGIELYLSPDASKKDKNNRKLSHLCLLAKNLQGWKQLVKINNRANKEDFFYYKPRIDLEHLSTFADGNILGFSGHPGSDVANAIFSSLNAYGAKTYEEAKSFVKADWERSVIQVAEKYRDILGKDNFFLEISLTDYKNFPAAVLISKILRHIGKKLDIPCIASIDSHYAEKADAIDQRVLLCSSLKTTLQEVEQKMDDGDEFGLSTFFRSNQFYIPSFEEIQNVYEPEELSNTVRVAEMCEQYSIFNKPVLPKCSDNSVQELREICRKGWMDKIHPYVDSSQHGTYKDRINHELKVIEDAGLSDYFLIVHDFIQYAHSQNIITGPGRGSAGGCLVSYLSDITSVDPIRFNLIFERFYNAGRNTKDKVALPDIDVDIPAHAREPVINYIREKYGHNQVGQICTFNRMMGRGAIKDVGRVTGVPMSEIEKITPFIPDEAKIADELEEMRKEGGDPSILGWTLTHRANHLKEWCTIEKDGSLSGPLAKLFAQAIRLEGTCRSTSKHASGLVIAPTNLEDFVPMSRDKSSSDLLVGLELEDMDHYGLPKFDLLGLSCLDRISTCVSLP